MALYRYSQDGLMSVEPTTLVSASVRERDDLQRLLRKRIEILGDDLLVVAEEYALFQDSRRRIDLLALDRAGSLVVIELKRTEDGGHMELQALRYAAMVSTMTPDQLVVTYAHYHHTDADEARQVLGDWVEGDWLEQLPNTVRIVLVSADFSTEITSTVLWLNQNYNTDISCFRLSPYRLGPDLLIDVQQIIPLPEAKDFQIQQRQKGASTAAAVAERSGRDFTKYSLRIGDRTWVAMSKQAVVKEAVMYLFTHGIELNEIKAVTFERRWVPVHPEPGETVEVAFVREYPERSPTHLWFDLDIVESNTHWITPRFGGRDTEPILADLKKIAAPKLVVEWSAAVSRLDGSDQALLQTE